MKTTIPLKINLSKIDKNRLFTSAKTGDIYLDAVLLFDTDKDKYGNNGMIIQSISKEEREAGEKGPILGNAKLYEQTQTVETPSNEPQDDLPF